MSQADSQQPKARKSHQAPRRISEIVAGLLLLLIVLILALPALISTGPVTRFLQRKVSQATRANIHLADLSLGWRKGIVIQGLDVTTADGLDRIRVKRIHSQPNILALMNKRWHLGKTVIEEPVLECKLSHSPQPSASSSAGVTVPVAPMSSRSLPIKSMEVEIRDGRVQLTSAEDHVLEVTGINSSVDLNPVGQSSFFEIDLNVPDRQQQPRSVRAEGQVKRSEKGWVLGLAAGQWNVDVNQLDLSVLQPLADMAGVELETQGRLSADLKGILEQDHTVGLKGTVHVQDLDVTPGSWQGDHLASKDVALDLDVQTFQQQLILNQATLQSDWAQLQLKGQVPLDPNQWRQTGQVSGSMDVQVAPVMQQIPHLLAVQPGMQVTDGRLEAQLDWLNGRLHGQATLKQLAGQVNNQRMSLSQDVSAKVQLDIHAPQWTLDTLTLDSAFAQLEVKGNRQRLELDNQLDLSRFQAEVGQFIDFKGLTLAGQMRSQAVVTLQQDDMNVTGTAQLRQLVLGRTQAGHINEPQAGVSLNAGWNMAERRLTIDSLSLNGSLGTVAVQNATGQWPQDAPLSLHAPVQVQDLKLGQALQWAKTLGWGPNDVKVAGELAGQFVVDAEHNAYRLRSERADVTALSLQLKDQKPFEQSTVTLALDTEINPVTRQILVHDFQWTSPQIKIQRAQLEKRETAGITRVAGAVQMDYDWDTVQPLVANVLPAGLEVQGRSLDFEAEMPSADPNLSRLSAQVKIGCEGARYQGLTLGAMDVNAVVKEGLLTLEPFTTTANEGQLAFGCQGDFRRHPPIFYTDSPLQVARDVHLTTAMTESLFQYINPLFANIDSVSGRADFYCERLVVPLDPNAKDQIEVTGIIDCNDVVLQGSTLFSLLRLNPQEFRIHPTRFVLADGVLSYDDMQIDVGNNPVNFGGRIGLDQRLDMTVTLPYTFSGRTARVGQAVTDRIAVPLTGTLKKPQVDIDKFLKKGLEQQLPNILNDVLKRL